MLVAEEPWGERRQGVTEPWAGPAELLCSSTSEGPETPRGAKRPERPKVTELLMAKPAQPSAFPKAFPTTFPQLLADTCAQLNHTAVNFIHETC